MIDATTTTDGRRESVFFYTFHRCASSLFADVVLPAVIGLRHVDPLGLIYCGRAYDAAAFESHGYVYGPIRISVNEKRPGHDEITMPTTERGFVRDRRAAFMVRDPRDLLVSAYYSFGFSHEHSPVPEIRASQARRRETIRSQSVDAYVLDVAPSLRENFETAWRLVGECRRGVVLRYEDMVDDWARFARDLTQVFDLEPALLARIHDESRPREVEDVMKHRRSGRVGGYRDHLEPATIEALDGVFGPVLRDFGYAPTSIAARPADADRLMHR